jgi:hypothetical protein
LPSRIESLEAELQSCTDVKRRDEIVSELRVLRGDQSRLSVKKGIPKKNVTPIPPSYVKEREEIRKGRACFWTQQHDR